MRNVFAILIATLVSLCFFDASCTDDASSTPGVFDYAASINSEPLPVTADTAKVAFRDDNGWVENGLFCVAAIVDNQKAAWQRIWVRIELLDSTGNVLLINGDSSLVVRAVSDAVPPLGASAMFSVIPLDQVSGGILATYRLSGAGATLQREGPILLMSDFGGVRIQRPDPTDSTKVIETAFQATGTIDNPLNMVAEHPRLVLLLYGQNDRLYFVQNLNPEVEHPLFKMEREGPLQPLEKRKISCPISYEKLPAKLREWMIGRAVFQAYTTRE